MIPRFAVETLCHLAFVMTIVIMAAWIVGIIKF